ncbi:glycosyltransferase family 2 protein [Streptomyces californicus]
MVIPTRSKAPSLRATLVALAAQGHRGPYEVVVVDDGSTDGTRELLHRLAGEAAGPAPRVVEGPERGRAAARNAGAEAARGRRLLFLDDDILTAPGHLNAHQDFSETQALAHGPLREFPGARRWLERHAASDAAELAAAAARVAAGEEGRLLRNTLETLVCAMDEGKVPPVAPWAACVGANTSLPRALFEEVGGFDEGFGLGWGCEDLELGVRALAAGAHVVVPAPAAGVHLTHARPDRWEQHAANLDRFTALHGLRAVRELPRLLGEGGGVAAYVAACTGPALRGVPHPGGPRAATRRTRAPRQHTREGPGVAEHAAHLRLVHQRAAQPVGEVGGLGALPVAAGRGRRRVRELLVVAGPYRPRSAVRP